MLPVFNIIRLVIFGTVIAWSIIVLGVAVFLNHILVASDLTRFIPLAIFVSVMTLFILPALLIFGALKSSTLISQTRFELASVGLLGILWLVLGVYTSTQEVADVECDDSDFDYSSATYHAQYHVVQAFSLFNTILLWAFLFLFLFLALRQRLRGNRDIWTEKVTTFAWLGAGMKSSNNGNKSSSSEKNKSSSSRKAAQLPQPATSKEKSSGSKSSRANQGPTVVPPQAPPKGKGGHTYVVFIPPPNNNTRQQQQQIYPQRR